VEMPSIVPGGSRKQKYRPSIGFMSWRYRLS
jgi:hypothetical protein